MEYQIDYRSFFLFIGDDSGIKAGFGLMHSRWCVCHAIYLAE